MKKQQLGRAGEEEAAAFLKKKGYVLAARNYRAKVGEIDIIASICPSPWDFSRRMGFFL